MELKGLTPWGLYGASLMPPNYVNPFYCIPRIPSGVLRNQRFRWLVIYYPYTIVIYTSLAVLWLAVSPKGVTAAQLQLYAGPLSGRRVPSTVELRVLPE